MKTIKLYYIFDNVGETVIAGPQAVANDLVAAIQFRDSFINIPEEEKKKMKYSYKALDLVSFAECSVDEDGCLEVVPEGCKINRIKGKDVIEFINQKSIELGIDDNFVEEN